MKQLTEKEGRTLRSELLKRARAITKPGNDYEYFLDDTPAKQLYYHKPFFKKPEVKRLTHYSEDPNVCCKNGVPVICLCIMKTGQIYFHRHRKGECPFTTYTKNK